MSLVKSALLLRETSLTGLPYSDSDIELTFVDAGEFQENFDAGREFHLVIWDKMTGSPKQALDAGRLEVVRAISASGNVVTVERAKEGTDAVTFDDSGEWIVSLTFTPAVIQELERKTYGGDFIIDQFDQVIDESEEVIVSGVPLNWSEVQDLRQRTLGGEFVLSNSEIVLSESDEPLISGVNANERRIQMLEQMVIQLQSQI